MASPRLPLDRLLRPITPGPRSKAPASEYSPDGSGRDYAYEYEAFEKARRVVAEVTRRDDEHDAKRLVWRREPVTADWARVLQLGIEVLSEESKDLQVAAWVVEALGHLHGFGGLREGFYLMRRLQGRFWASAYPRLEADDYQYRSIPYQFLDAEKLLPLLIRSIPLTDALGGGRYSYLRDQEAKESERLLLARPEEDREDYRVALRKRNRILVEDWNAAIEMTPDGFYLQLAGEVRDCLMAFKAWDRASERLFGDQAPGLTQIEKALADCAELVASMLPESAAQADALSDSIACVRGERRRTRIPPASRHEEPAGPHTPAPSPKPPEDRTAGDTDNVSDEDRDAVGRPRPVGESRDRVDRPALVATDGDHHPAVADAPPTDTDTAYRRVWEAATFLRANDPSNPVPYLLVRAMGIGGLYALKHPPGPGDLPGPSREARVKLRQLAADQHWEELVEQSESSLAAPEGRAWLDAHRFADRALEALDRPQVVRACRSFLSAVLKDFEELPALELDDGTTSANGETRSWLVAAVLNPDHGGVRARECAPLDDHKGREAETDVEEPSPGPWERATALAQAGRVEEAALLLAGTVGNARCGREEFLSTFQLAEFCTSEGLDQFAAPLLTGLARRGDEHDLLEWEGRTFFTGVALALYRSLQRLGGEVPPERLAEAHARLCRLDPAAALREAVTPHTTH